MRVIEKYPIHYLPSPSDDDYVKGYIIRYFIKTFDSKYAIVEVDNKQYNYFNRPIYTLGYGIFRFIKLKWTITGEKDTVIENNTKILNFFEQKMVGISIKLGNRLQFWNK